MPPASRLAPNFPPMCYILNSKVAGFVVADLLSVSFDTFGLIECGRQAQLKELLLGLAKMPYPSI